MTGTPQPAMALLHEGRPVHVAPLPAALLRRALRAAQLRGIDAGYLPAASPCRASVQILASRGGEAAEPCFVRALGLFVQAIDPPASFACELTVTALLPLARQWVSALVEGDALREGEVCEPHLVALPHGTSETAFELPAPVMLAAKRDAVSHDLAPEWASRDDLPVHVDAQALADAIAYCQATTEHERGGVLLGHLCHDAERGLWVRAGHFAAACGAESERAAMRFTAEAWSAIHTARRAIDPTLQVVAWVHSHPPLGTAEEPVADVRFLSWADQACHAAHFPDAHLTALVVDAAGRGDPGDVVGAFGWDAHGIGLVRRSLDVASTAVPSPESFAHTSWSVTHAASR